jgi:RNA polymerase sigma-70 factor (ECF subfamily)
MCLQTRSAHWKSLTDEELIAAYRGGWGHRGKEAVEELFARYHARLIRWCFRFARDRESVLDLSQEIFLRAYRNLDYYRGESRFSTWLYVITRNICVDASRKRASEPVWEENISDLPDMSATCIHATVEREERWRFILDTLDRTEAQVMLLHYGEELPLKAVSQMLGLANKCGAKAYIVSARRKLKIARSSPIRSLSSSRSLSATR